jgi:transcriptional regulator with AAA-type ATPase domain
MDRQKIQEFQDQVKLLREDGKTIRAIADKLGAPRSNVHRAVRALAQRAADTDPISYLDDKEPFFDSSDSSTVIGVERPHSQASPVAGAFVGREPEMEQLKKAMEESMAGQPHLTMLVGEPGIGKTRISQEIASYARSRGGPGASWPLLRKHEHAALLACRRSAIMGHI